MTGSKPDTGCVFCDAPLPPHPDTLIVYQGKTCYVILNRYPYNNGHLMVVPHRHVGLVLAGGEPDGVEQVRLPEAGAAVQVERVVADARRLGDGVRRRRRQPVRRADDEIGEGVLRVQSLERRSHRRLGHR